MGCEGGGRQACPPGPQSRAEQSGGPDTHPGTGLRRAWPAPPRLLERKRWCTPRRDVRGLKDTHTPNPRLPFRPMACLTPPRQVPTTHCAVWADEATHILHDPEHLQPCLPTESQLPPHVPHGHRLRAGNQSPPAAGYPQSTAPRARRAEEGAWPRERPPYLGRSDHEGPQGTVGAQGVHGGHVLVRGSWRRVYDQVVQLPPGHVRHELLYECCEGPGSHWGRSKALTSSQPAARGPLQAQGPPSTARHASHGGAGHTAGGVPREHLSLPSCGLLLPH